MLERTAGLVGDARRNLTVVLKSDLLLGTVLERLAAAHGSRAVAEEAGPDGLHLTYAQAADQVDAWAGVVAGASTRGDRVVVALPNGYDFFLACLGVSRAGRIPVPVNQRMRADEVEHVIDDSGASLVLDQAEAADGALPFGPAAPAEPADVAAIFYTSGTTGRPKGAELTHRGLLAQLRRAAMWPSALRRDEAVVALPVAHIMGFASLLGLAAAGIPVYVLATFRAEAVLDAIEGRRATMFIGVPAMYRMLLEAGAADRDLSSVRVWASGADVMPPELARRFKGFGATATVLGRGVGQAAFVEGYGMVELAGSAAVRVSPPGFDLPFLGALGVPLPGHDFKVVDDEGKEVGRGVVGDLLVRGPGVLAGYHDDQAATSGAITEDGYLCTGDLARRGLFGTVGFAGRSKDVVKVGGFSVFAVEVERALEEHPDVLEAAVVGLPDERLGEVTAAAVRVRPGAPRDPGPLLAWAREEMASYKVPRRLVVVDELPRTGTTKVQKAALLPLFDLSPQ